jgi:DNA-binding MarR family transcriptional regulator
MAAQEPTLFPLFAAGDTRRVLQALLRKELRQVELCGQLGVTSGAMGASIRRLEEAGLVSRPTPRGKLRITRFDQVAKLLELEAELTEEVLEEKRDGARERRHRIRKDRMSGGAGHGRASGE